VGTGVRWSHNARREVDEIRAYIERDSKAGAVHVVGEFLDAADRLAIYPLSGRIIQTWKNPERRELIVGSYRVMYRVSSRGHHGFQRPAYEAASSQKVSQ
jgi:plasmid stabilization system protein ParE